MKPGGRWRGGGVAAVGLLAGLAPGGCGGSTDNTSVSCDCPPGELIATSTAGASFAVAGDGCAGTCRTQGTDGCREFVVTAQGPATCTVSASGAAVGASGVEQKVSFALDDCCDAVMPSPRSWAVP